MDYRVHLRLWDETRFMNAAFHATRFATAVAAILGVLGIAFAQQTGSVAVPPSPPSNPSLVPQWSGLSGSSGHPLMTADAIRAAAADFPNCLERLWPDAARRGVSRESFVNQIAWLTPDLRIMDLLDSQPEFTRSIWDYLDLLVNDERVRMGQEVLARHRETFDLVENAFGVDRHIVTAIWGVESRYGSMIGERPVLRSTATLACIGRRQAYFRDEFLAALEILHRGDVRPEQLKGSWAGAFGPTQFMPTSFKRYAVDFDGDGRRDVVDSTADMIASTANNLKKDGWVTGQPWGYEVVLPSGFDYLLADRTLALTVSEWENLGLRRPDGKAFSRREDRAFLLLPAGAQGPAFLMMPNFDVLMKYNPAEAYALAIGYLADRLRGDALIVQSWPRHEPVLTREQRRELQVLLLSRGFDLGEADGRLGLRSRAAIRNYQVSIGVIPDGFASAEILMRLRVR
jgi:membrane-bound lytic murein transglycosylase B